MSFRFEWPESMTDLTQKLELRLAEALKSGPRPDNLQGGIDLIDFSLGTRPPELEILDVDELRNDRFRGLFRITYRGDADIKLQTCVQMNPIPEMLSPINIKLHEPIAFANKKFVVPMRFRISDMVLSGVFLLALDRSHGVTLTFKNDPLEKVKVSSNFENIPAIERYIKIQIEAYIRKMLQVDLPALIHSNANIASLNAANGDSSPVLLSTSSQTSSFADYFLPDFAESFTPSLYSRDNLNYTIGGSVATIASHKRTAKWQNNEGVDYDDLVWSEGYFLNSSLGSKFNHLNYGLKKIDQRNMVFNKHIFLRKIKRDTSTLASSTFNVLCDLNSPGARISSRSYLTREAEMDAFIGDTAPHTRQPRNPPKSVHGRGTLLNGYSAPGHWDNTVASDKYKSQRLPASSLKMFLVYALQNLKLSLFRDITVTPDDERLPLKPIVIKNISDTPLLLHMKNISRLAATLNPTSFIDVLPLENIILKKDMFAIQDSSSIAHKLLLNIKINGFGLQQPSASITSPSNASPSSLAKTPHCRRSRSPTDPLFKLSTSTLMTPPATRSSPSRINTAGKMTFVSGKSDIAGTANVTSILSTRGLYDRWLDAGYDPHTKTLRFPRKRSRYSKPLSH